MSVLKRSHIYNDDSETTTLHTDLQINSLRHIIKIVEILEHVFKNSENSKTYTENYNCLKYLDGEFQITLAHVYQAVQRKKHGYQNINSMPEIEYSEEPQSNPITQKEDINENKDYKLSWLYLEIFSRYINQNFVQNILYHLLKVIVPLCQPKHKKKLKKYLKQFNPKQNCLALLEETVNFLHLEKIHQEILTYKKQENNKDKKQFQKIQKIINLTLNSQIIEIKKFSALIAYLNQFKLKEKMHHNDKDIIQQPASYWKNLENKIQYSLIFDNLQILDQQMHHFLHMVSLTVSTCYATRNVNNFILRQIQETLYTALFKLSRKYSFQETNKFLGDPDPKTQIQTAIRIWNGMDKIYALRYFVQATCFEYIQYHRKIYLPRISQPLSLEQIFKWQEDKSFDKQEELQMKNKWDKNIYEKSNKLKKIKVRLISGKNLIEKQPEIVQRESLLTKMTHKINITNFERQEKNKEIDTVIIHIHGGGWVSMSSFTHQVYTRKWANYKGLKGIPIFSIDYRKSPKYAYPCALDDCFQAYVFILKEIQNYYNINPKNIILTGDSAGGNMCMGIVQLCLKYSLKLPDIVVLSYPAMNLSASNYTPSLNYALDDLICPFQFMKMCQSLLIQNDKIDPENDPLISPLVMSNETIQKLPPIKITVGEKDSLKDDSIRFLKRLQDNNHEQSELLIYTGLKHGYLNYDVPFGIRLARKCIDDTAEFMLQYYEKNLQAKK